MLHPTAKVSAEVNKEVASQEHNSTTFYPYTDPEYHNTLCHRQTDRQTDDNIMLVARPAKNQGISH